jgi:hypothetical protein
MYFIKETILEKVYLKTKFVFLFCIQILGEIFLILRRIQWTIIINLHTAWFYWNMNFHEGF